jgi:ERCC4-type nuclease
MKSVTVLVDSREKYPLFFPAKLEWWRDRGTQPHLIKVKTKVMKLDIGDYQLADHEDCCVFERKGSIRELHNNLLTDDFPRFMTAIRRLATVQFPYLLLDIRPGEVLVPTKDVPQPARVFAALCGIFHHFNIRVFYSGRPTTAVARRSLGTQVLLTMLGHAYPQEIQDGNSHPPSA